jgi:hypothetical protein
VSIGFERNVLTRYRGQDRSDTVPVELRCSRYEVRLRSSDALHAIGYQGDQDGERWFLVGLNAAGQVIFTTDPTPDLSDHQTEAVFSMGVADLRGVVAFRAQHVGSGDNPNSITVDATLVPVP